MKLQEKQEPTPRSLKEFRKTVKHEHEQTVTANMTFLYLHVFMVPLELWLDKYRFAYNNAVLESPSAGFIRIPPKTPLYNVRGYIQDQLGTDVIPVDFIFLRSVGRCLAVVNKNQEMKMKINEFVPPATYSPELFLLPCKHEDVFTSAESSKTELFYNDLSSKENSDDSPLESNDDVPFSSLPNNGMAVVEKPWELNNNFVMSAAPDIGTSLSETPPKMGVFKKRIQHRHSFTTNTNNTSKTIITNTSRQNGNEAKVSADKVNIPTRPSTASTPYDDNIGRLKFKPEIKRHSLSVTPNPLVWAGNRSVSPSPSNVRQFIKPEIALIPATPMVNFPLPSAQVIVSRSQNLNEEIVDGPLKNGKDEEKETSSKEEGVNKLSRISEKSAVEEQPENSNNTKDEKIMSDSKNAELDLVPEKLVENDNDDKTSGRVEEEEKDPRRSALEARVKERFEKEQKRLEETNALDKEISPETHKELLEQMHELRKKNGTLNESGGNVLTHGSEKDGEIISKLKEIGDVKKRRSDEMKLRELKNEQQERIKMEEEEEKKAKLEELKKKLEQAKLDKHAVQRTREANGKRIRQLQAESNNRNVQKQNYWKKKYEEELKQTTELEELLKKMKADIEIQHRKLVSHSSPLTRTSHQQTKGAPSERNNQKNMVIRLENEIEELKMMTELTTKKLSAESKMKSFAVQELKDLRSKAMESKINASRAKKTLSPQNAV